MDATDPDTAQGYERALVVSIVIGLDTHLLPGIGCPSDGGEKPPPLIVTLFLVSAPCKEGKGRP